MENQGLCRGGSGSPSIRSVRSISTVNEIEEGPSEPAAPPEDKVYVAVKAEVKEGKANLLWAIANAASGSKTVVLCHVLQSAQKIPTLLGKLPVDVVSPQEVKAFRKLERDKTHKRLDDYHTICAKWKVRTEKVIVEANDIAMGLVELIAQHGITTFVMGAAADKHFSRKLKQLKSQTAITVEQLAEPTCQIYFVCKGSLIYTRTVYNDASGVDTSPIAQLDTTSPLSSSSQQQGSRTFPSRQSNLFTPDRTPTQQHTRSVSLGYQGDRNVTVTHSSPRVEASIEGSPYRMWEGTSSFPQSGQSSPWNSEAISRSGTFSLNKYEESEVGSELLHSAYKPEDDLQILRIDDLHSSSSNHVLEDLGFDSSVYNKLQEASREAENLKNEACVESSKRRKAEMDAILALQKATASEHQSNKETRQRKEIEETLARERLEVKKLKEQHDEISEHLQEAIKHKLELETRIVELDHIEKDFEEKISQEHRLLLSLQAEYNELQQKLDDAVNKLEELRHNRETMVAETSGNFETEFSYLELMQATQNFNDSLKVGEGGFGSVFKGFLRNTDVAIKVLHPHSLQGQSEFQQEVAVLSKVRHPNLVTLIGACRENLALIYEFLPNGNLEERLACKNSPEPLTWQVRTRIISEICSALIFLHSCKPHPVVHGDLKPANILLDANHVSKLGDFGICRFLIQNNTRTTLFRKTHPKGTFAYIDPEFLTTGEMTPQSDVYSFGIVILRLLTGKPALAIARDVQNALCNDNLHVLIDPSAGDWPYVQAKQLAHIGLKCCEMSRKNRPDLVEVWRRVEPMIKSASLSASLLSFRSISDNNNHIPSYFICPIFQEIMKDPQMASDGFTYEAEAIKGWIEGGYDTSPMTNLKLPNCDLIPNRALSYAIQEWHKQQQSY